MSNFWGAVQTQTSVFRRPFCFFKFKSIYLSSNRTAALRFRFGGTEFQFAQGGEVGFGSGDQNVGIRALSVDDAVAACQPHTGFALAFRALRYGVTE